MPGPDERDADRTAAVPLEGADAARLPKGFLVLDEAGRILSHVPRRAGDLDVTGARLGDTALAHAGVCEEYANLVAGQGRLDRCVAYRTHEGRVRRLRLLGVYDRLHRRGYLTLRPLE